VSRRRRSAAGGRRWGALLGALGLFLLATPVSAYTTITSPASRWVSSDIPVPVYLNQNGSADIGIDSTEREVQAAFDTWNNVDCCYFVFGYQGRTGMTAGGSSGNNVISWSESGWGYESGAIAVTSDWFGRGTIVEADMDCNGVTMTWNTTGSRGGVDTQSIMAHEMGHMLGLGDLYDSAHSSSTMYGIYSGGTGSRSLAEDDMAGCRFLYEEPCGGCVVDTDCPSGYHCEAPTCVRNTTSGNMCDPCSSPDDCSAGLCLSGFVDGGSYCGVNCTTDADCGAGNTCYAVTGGPSQCAPTDGDCSGGSSGCTTDSECPSGYHCEAPTCVRNEPVPDCTVDTDCGTGRHCEGGTCIDNPPTARGFGEPCTSDTQCGSGLCLGGICTQSCDPSRPFGSCPGGYYCDDVSCGEGRCRAGNPGVGEQFALCGSDAECQSGFCDLSRGAGVCLNPCNPSEAFTTCQLGETCQPIGGPNCGACLCGPGMFGDPCNSDLECVVGLCRAAVEGELPRCTTACVNGACPFGASCSAVLAPDGSSEMRCAAGGQRLGGRCAANEECQSGFCWAYNGQSFCTRPCGGICGCPSSQTCVTSGSSAYCVPSAVAADDGCGCRAPGAAPASGLLGLFAVVFALGLRSVRRRG
jgi:MYXO-CTERM domain-containing protein